jgi:hypothetical protein
MAAPAKFQADAILNAALTYIATSTMQFVISAVADAAAPTYAECAGTYDLATHIMAGGDFAQADGAVNGRKVTIAEQAAITVDHSGTALGVVLGISAGTVMVFVTTCTSQALVSANTVTIPAWTITFADVTA